MDFARCNADFIPSTNKQNIVEVNHLRLPEILKRVVEPLWPKFSEAGDELISVAIVSSQDHYNSRDSPKLVEASLNDVTKEAAA